MTPTSWTRNLLSGTAKILGFVVIATAAIALLVVYLIVLHWAIERYGSAGADETTWEDYGAVFFLWIPPALLGGTVGISVWWVLDQWNYFRTWTKQRGEQFLFFVLGGAGTAVVVYVFFLAAGGAGTGSDELESQTAVSDSTPVSTAEMQPSVTPHQRVLNLVQAAAEADQGAHVVDVACPRAVQAGEIALSTCAVTFVGPSCQFWSVIDSGDQPEVLPFSEPQLGRKAAHDGATGVRCVQAG